MPAPWTLGSAHAAAGRAAVVLLLSAFSGVAMAADPDPRHAPFFTSIGGEFDEPLNRMWRIYGAVTEEEGAVIRFGKEAAWHEWMARKLMWSGEDEYRDAFRAILVEYPMSENGYVWSWTDQAQWPTEPPSYHQENNAKYILGVCRYFFWTRDKDFLHARDPVSRGPGDASEGMTVLQKIRAAMAYQLEELNGRDGMLVIRNGHNTGRPDGAPTNYWDNFPFGHKDGYTNIYYYASLLALADLEEILGETEQAEDYRALAAETASQYRSTFWNEDTGRFLGCIDEDGARWDLGFTFLNTEAMTYSLADDAQAEEILAWLHGERVIADDTSQGDDIYAFGFAPRSTTVDVAALGEPYWWKPVLDNGEPQITVGPGGSATYGEHLENGGAIFYTSYYDIMARVKHAGPNDGWERFMGVMDEFAKDELRRNPSNNVGAEWKVGVIGVFPESGLVPTAFLHAFLGVTADGRGLRVAPALPEALDHAGVRGLRFGGGSYTLTIDGETIAAKALADGETRLMGTAGNLRPGAAYAITVTDADNEPRKETRIEACAKGDIPFDTALSEGWTLTIAPSEARAAE